MNKKLKYKVVRTVKNGQVKIMGRVFEPESPTHGRFDNQRWYFGLYYKVWEDDKPYMVSLMCSESWIKAKDENFDSPQDKLLINDQGQYEWVFWQRIS